jgi:sigma-54 dependent transcriptional regulator, acetoin dehydrogenase operon transcriptional activator AcoR
VNPSSVNAMYKVREKFLSDGYLEPNLARVVRPEIFASWRRSRMSGARATADALPFETEIAAGGPLCRAAEPVLARLAEQMSGLQCGVLLADRNARIIRRWAPNTAILARMDRVAAMAGSSASEEYVGTNGIGTIVEDRKSHIIVGAEHFADVLSSFTCVGAPIFHPLSRKFEGVVTLNADVNAASPLLTSLMASTAQEIEGRLLELSSRRERALLDAFMVASRSGGVIAVVGDDVLLAGPAASRALRELDQGVMWQEVRDALDGRARRAVISLTSTQGVLTTISCTPVLVDERPIGAIVEVLPSKTNHQETPVARALASPRWETAAELLPGRSATWQAVLREACLYRSVTSPVLILGETGTGKLTLARAMAEGEDCVVVDCLAAPTSREDWRSRIANGADRSADVVILEHLNALSQEAASALSVVLDELAHNNAAPRFIATASLVSEWVEGGVGQRLLGQLGVNQIELPPLRDRREDIPVLLTLFGARHRGITPLRFGSGALQALGRAPWPGNVRQLENVVRTLVAAGRGREVSADDLPDGLAAYSSGRNLTRMEQLELDAIRETIGAAQGNKVEAARLLGISRSTLYRKMRRYRLDPEHTFF